MSKVYNLKQTQFIKADLAKVWEFFSTPSNLNKITPAVMRFEVLNITGSDNMYTGQLISYKVSPFPFIRLRWTTEIRNVVPLHSFADEQKLGPFVLWYHQHFFTAKDGGVEMIDEVSYALPFGILGRFAHWLVVKKQVEKIFKFRKEAVNNIFK